MNVNEAIEAVLDLVSSIFPEGFEDMTNVESNTRNLKEAVEGILQARNISLDTKMKDDNRAPTGCHVYVLFE